MPGFSVIRIETTLAPVARNDIVARRHEAIMRVMAKVKFDAVEGAIRPSSAYTTGEITGRLRKSIKLKPAEFGQILMRGNTEVYQILQDGNETPVEGGGSKGYGFFQERGTAPIKPKNKRWLYWRQTAKYHYGRRNYAYAWRLVGQASHTSAANFYQRRRNKTLSGTGAPYRGRNVTSRFRSAIMTDVHGKGKTATASLFVTHDIFARETQGLKPKHYLQNAWNRHAKEMDEIVRNYTLESFDAYIAGKQAASAKRKAAAAARTNPA